MDNKFNINEFINHDVDIPDFTKPLEQTFLYNDPTKKFIDKFTENMKLKEEKLEKKDKTNFCISVISLVIGFVSLVVAIIALVIT